MWWQWVKQKHHLDKHTATEIKSKYNQLTKLSSQQYLVGSQYIKLNKTTYNVQHGKQQYRPPFESLAVFLYYFHDNTVIFHVVFPWKLKKTPVPLYSTRSGPEGSSLREGDTLQYRDESQQLWGRLGTRRVGTGERSSNNSGKEFLNRRIISGKPEGIVDGQFNPTGLEWSNIKTEEYLCAMLKADVNLMPVGSRVKRRGPSWDWLFTPGCLPMTGWFQAEGLIIWRDLRSAVTLRSYSIYFTVLHLIPPSKTYTLCVWRPKWFQWTIEWHRNMRVNSLSLSLSIDRILQKTSMSLSSLIWPNCFILLHLSMSCPDSNRFDRKMHNSGLPGVHPSSDLR